MTLHVKNDEGGAWEVVGTPISPGHHWGALEANGHNQYNPNNNGTNLLGKFYYTQNAQNWFTGLYNGNYHDISGNGPYTFVINSNYPIDTESFVLSVGKIGEMYDASNAYTIQWENNNKTAKVTFDELKAVNQIGSAFAATYYVITNTINDEIIIESYAEDDSGQTLGDKTTASETYYLTSSGSFLPHIITKDKTIYTTDPALDLKSIVSAFDQIDGDISQNVQIIDDNNFDQSKPGVYKIKYRVSNSFGEVAEGISTVTVIENKVFIEAHDSTINVGDEWKPEDNFDSATDKDGNPVDFSRVTVTGTVNTTNPGKYEIIYEFNGVSKTITVTVLGITLEPTPNIDSNHNHPNIRKQDKNINPLVESNNIKKAPSDVLPNTGETSEQLLTLFGFLSLILGVLWFFSTKNRKTNK